MNVQSNHSLQALNSFGFAVRAEHYVRVDNDADLQLALALATDNQWPVFLLGGGSNLVLTKNITGLVIHPVNQTTVYELQPDGSTLVTASAGKNWHELVIDTLQHGLTGLENLSLIPGNTGAAPVQNIGAYGVELVDRLFSVRAFHRPSNTWLTLTPDDCEFNYRDSVFKRNPNNYIITHVSFLLREDIPPVLTYAALKNTLSTHSESAKNLCSENNLALAKLISDTVIRIRQSKLPDPKMIGNAGSFFKNPVVSEKQAAKLRQEHPEMVSYPQADGRVKLAAGWMIDALGFKGCAVGNVGVHTEQALVLVNRGSGTGDALMALARDIIAQVETKYGVRLEIEPLVV